MTSPDTPDAATAPAPAPGPSGGRRRALGRGPGAGGDSGPAAPVPAPEPPAERTDPESTGTREPSGADETPPASVIPPDRGASPEPAEAPEGRRDADPAPSEAVREPVEDIPEAVPEPVEGIREAASRPVGAALEVDEAEHRRPAPAGQALADPGPRPVRDPLETGRPAEAAQGAENVVRRPAEASQEPAARPPRPVGTPHAAGTAPEPAGQRHEPHASALRPTAGSAVADAADAADAAGAADRPADARPVPAEAGPSPGPDDPREPAEETPAPDQPQPQPQPTIGPETAPGTPDGVFTVRLANFEGPFDLLLQLISKHKLDVTEVALSKVTDEFMAHIRAMGPDWDLDQTTEFLVVAATLLDLKAARLLPAAEVEDEADLALLEARDLLFARLLQYRAYKQIADILNARLDEEARRYPRTVGLEAHHAELLPEVVISIGAEGFAKLAVKAMQPRVKPQVYVEHIHAPLVSVQEQAGIVVARLRLLGEASFRALVDDTDDTLTVVARFLALLELYREKAVALDQETALGDLLVRWTGGDGDGLPRVTDEFDRPPENPEKADEPGKPGKPGKAEKPGKAGKPEKSPEVDTSQRPDRGRPPERKP